MGATQQDRELIVRVDEFVFVRALMLRASRVVAVVAVVLAALVLPGGYVSAEAGEGAGDVQSAGQQRISLGYNSSCVVVADDTIRCWALRPDSMALKGRAGAVSVGTWWSAARGCRRHRSWFSADVCAASVGAAAVCRAQRLWTGRDREHIGQRQRPSGDGVGRDGDGATCGGDWHVARERACLCGLGGHDAAVLGGQSARKVGESRGCGRQHEYHGRAAVSDRCG